MTVEEAKRKLADICADIVSQNLELISAMDAPDFDPAIRLDNTKNNAAYKLTDFFDILKCFPYGHVPHEVTNELISSTDELLQKIRKKYGATQEVLRQIILAGQAFRNSKRIWRIKDPIKKLPKKTYEKKLDDALHDILHALDDLNYELHLMQNEPRSPNITEKIDVLTRESRRNGNLIRETLWHASGKLPQYKPTDGRSIGVVKEGMVQMAIDRILEGKGDSPRAILNGLLGQYADIPDAYHELTPFLRQVERVLKKTEHNLKDMF